MTEKITELSDAVVARATTDADSSEPKTVEQITGALEALLLIADEPMPEVELAAAVDAPTSVVTDALAELVAFYDETGRGFELRQVGGGWRYYTREEHADLVGRYLLDGQQAKLSQAALETLAVVAYQQPISRARISAVRGVNVDGVMRTLLARGLVAEAGHDAESGAVTVRDHRLLPGADGAAQSGRAAAAGSAPARGRRAGGRAVPAHSAGGRTRSTTRDPRVVRLRGGHGDHRGRQVGEHDHEDDEEHDG